jgi:hypothetical protein
MTRRRQQRAASNHRRMAAACFFQSSQNSHGFTDLELERLRRLRQVEDLGLVEAYHADPRRLWQADAHCATANLLLLCDMETAAAADVVDDRHHGVG